ncbi:MAG: hypothetical protein WA635_08525 [Gallionella sp.]
MRLLGPDHHGKSKQRGAALMIMVALLVVGFAALLVGALSLPALNSARQEKTAAALAEAKNALIGKSITYDDYPGSLPCPDTDNDGVSDAGGASDCPNYIGRLPWKTLGLPDLQDAAGERLWYTLSSNFRRYDSVRPLNSNTKGTLLVYGADNVQLTQANYSAVAVIFAPGSAISAQARNTVAERNAVANYLDEVVFPGPITRNNAAAGGPFVAGAKSATFNDQLVFITAKELMPLVERRVAGIVKEALTSYYANSSGTPSDRYYPWTDNLPEGGTFDYDANDGQTRGWLPYHSSDAGSLEWYASGSPPQWFFDNQWYTLIYYSIAPKYTRDHFPLNTLTVDSTTGVRALFFMPGTYDGTRASTDPIPLTQFLEDGENNDNGNDSYVRPTSTDRDRDRLYWLSSSSIWNQ